MLQNTCLSKCDDFWAEMVSNMTTHSSQFVCDSKPHNHVLEISTGNKNKHGRWEKPKNCCKTNAISWLWIAGALLAFVALHRATELQRSHRAMLQQHVHNVLASSNACYPSCCKRSIRTTSADLLSVRIWIGRSMCSFNVCMFSKTCIISIVKSEQDLCANYFANVEFDLAKQFSQLRHPNTNEITR